MQLNKRVSQVISIIFMAGIAIGAGFFVTTKASAQAMPPPVSLPEPQFYSGGKIVDSVECGETITLNIPGYDGKIVWLDQYKFSFANSKISSKTTYSGTFHLPMPAYQTICGKDEGSFHNSFSEAKPDPYPYSGNFYRGDIISWGQRFTVRSKNEPEQTPIREVGTGIFSMEIGPSKFSEMHGFAADIVVKEFIGRYSADGDNLFVFFAPSFYEKLPSGFCTCAWLYRRVVDGIGSVRAPYYPPEWLENYFLLLKQPCLTRPSNTRGKEIGCCML